ncbi:MAG: TetR/AcrR family transcriptional regulator [Candidatus Marinimicrobia bacterium]|nr:TetR/AcrR family transcriptional regulator [Candidatus Neomarinimicrobiota bacterium]
MKQLTKRQNQIIQESIKLIAEKGIQGLTIKNISKAIGVSEPAIYRHFESKKEIIKGIIALLQEPAGNDKPTAPDAVNGFAKVRTLVENHTARFIKNPPITAIVFSEDIFNNESSISQTVKSLMQRNQEKIIQIVIDGQADGSIRNDLGAEQLSLTIIGSFRFLVNKWHLNNYDFNLKNEVYSLLNSIEIMIKP